MKSTEVIVVPNDDAEIKKFAEAVGISLERAKYIESMRPTYLAYEHDYIKTPKPRRLKKKITT
jgi:hypothetical protein